MIEVRADFDAAELQPLARLLDEGRILTASRRASRKVAGWVRTQMARALGNEAKLPKRILSARGKVYDKGWRTGVSKGAAFKVWFGLDPIFADRIGAPQKLARGYRVGRHTFKTAFMPKRGRYADKLYLRTTEARLPIMRARVEIDAAGKRIFDRLATDIEGRFMELLQHELRYEVLKMEGRAR